MLHFTPGVKFVNGYSVLPGRKGALLLDIGFCGFMAPASVQRLLPNEAGPDGLLELMGVDGIVLGRDYAQFTRQLEDLGWIVVAKTTRDVLLHRCGPPLPIARSLTEIDWVARDDEIPGCIRAAAMRRHQLFWRRRIQNASAQHHTSQA